MPEFWGKDSPYHPGTDFLGTPKDHLDVSCWIGVPRNHGVAGPVNREIEACIMSFEHAAS